MEAASEIAYQIRLRNLSGMILVDFINMNNAEDQEALIKEMQKLCAARPRQDLRGRLYEAWADGDHAHEDGSAPVRAGKEIQISPSKE